MKGPVLNRLHRYVGIIIAPCLVVQAFSGFFLEFGPFRRTVSGAGATTAPGWWDRVWITVHFGPGFINDAYHILLGCGILWMAVSGWLLYLRIRRFRSQSRAPAPPGT